LPIHKRITVIAIVTVTITVIFNWSNP